MEVKTFKKDLAGRELIVETGKLANQANGSVTVQYGGTVVLATAVMSDNVRDGINYFPLMVDYEERLYAAGKIKGSRFIKREGRPTDEAILSGRMIDRTIRPLFNDRIRNDIQVVLTILSIDQENDPDICSLIGASLALAISDIPWDGPIGAVRVAKVDGKLIVNPTYEEREQGSFDVIIAGKDDQINMIEGGGKEVLEEEVLEKIKFSQKCVKEIIDFQKEIISEIGKEKKEARLIAADEETENEMKKFLADRLDKVVFADNKDEKQKESKQLREDLQKFIEEKFGDDKNLKYIADLVTDEEIDALVHKAILEEDKRPDKRNTEEIRKISAQVGLLPRTHGSGLFNRGETQALTVATLGSPGDEQTLDSMKEEGTKRFMHHYTFPSFSVGETGPMRGPGRREIGHGALAEKALQP